MSGCQMVRYSNGGLKKGLLMVQNVRYSNGLPSLVILPFEYQTPILSSIQMNLVFRCWVFRWLLYSHQVTMLITHVNNIPCFLLYLSLECHSLLKPHLHLLDDTLVAEKARHSECSLQQDGSFSSFFLT